MTLRRDYPPEPLFRGLPHELGTEIVDGLPADSLLRLRSTCSLADAYVSIAFQRRLHRVVQHFVEDVDGLLRLLDDLNAGFTGPASLTFVFPACPNLDESAATIARRTARRRQPT